MNWGKSIVVAFVLFALFIGVLVFVCVKQDISLVSKNYYQEELAYQQQMERMKNTEDLDVKPAMKVVDGQLEIRFVDFDQLEKGELKLFRPSDVSLDKSFPLTATTDVIQQIDVAHLPAGMYKAKLQWAMNGKEYYLESIINL